LIYILDATNTNANFYLMQNDCVNYCKKWYLFV